MYIRKLELENFASLNGTFDFADGVNIVEGPNGCGKSTIANAVAWILTRKSLDGSSFCPKTIDAEGKEKHGMQHSASAQFVFDDGSVRTLKVMFRENIKKRKLKAEGVFEYDGHSATCFIDDREVREKEYNDLVNTLFGTQQQIQCLLSPHFFSQDLAWKERRAILMQIAGDVDEMELLKKDGYDAIRPLFGNGALDSSSLMKAQREELKRTKDELSTIGPRIDEARAAIPSSAGIQTRAACEESIARLTKELEELRDGGTDSDTPLDEARRSVDELTEAVASYRRRFLAEMERHDADAMAAMEKAAALVNESALSLQNKEQRLSALTRRLEDMRSRAEGLRARWKAVRSRTFQEETFDASATFCPTCGRELPEGRINQMIMELASRNAKARASFQKSRDEELGAIEAEAAECGKEACTRLEGEIGELESSIERERSLLETRKGELDEARNALKDPKTGLEEDEGYLALTRRLESARCECSRLEGEEESSATERQERIAELSRSLDEQRTLLSDIGFRENQEKRIQVLCERKEELEAMERDLEGRIGQLAALALEKAEHLTHSVNSRFSKVRFNLFHRNLVGTFDETCETLVRTAGGGWIPFSSASNAEKINGGLEMVKALSGFWGKSMPVIIDNAESVIDVVNTGGQQIRLSVAPSWSIHPEAQDE